MLYELAREENHAPDLATELIGLLRAGCRVELDPFGYGMMVAKITPPRMPEHLDGVIDYGGAPDNTPFISQFNIVMLSWDLPIALRNARRLFVGLIGWDGVERGY